ncbi:HGGxSTG domain-containing protein [Limnohabitans sp. DCL3]|uniref:HGGxSTG domain-containing protein n=1 Tax=Limnohabitans sp. DCL3 TaxID=3374103 RepID=UPI003A89057B
MSKNDLQPRQLLTLGGRIHCNQCQAKSKRSGVQCLGPAVKGKKVCRMHGGTSTGPKTPEGRLRCALAKTIHGQETAQIRMERSLASARLAVLESVGHALGLLKGPRTRGRKPNQMHKAYPGLQAAALIHLKKQAQE